MSEFQNLKFDRLRQLINVNLTINESYDNFEVVLQRLLHAIEIITNCEVTSFLLYDKETKDLTFSLASGKNTHDLIGLVVPHGKGIAHEVIRSKKSILINNIDEAKDKHYIEIDKILDFKTENLMAFPMLDDNGDIIGVIEACNKKNNDEFTNEDYQILLIFCQHAERTLRHTLRIITFKDRLQSLNKKMSQFYHSSFIYGSKETETKFTFAKKIANSRSQVLVYGEKGTGKTNLATQIHRFSNRRDKDIEYINCAHLSLQNEQEQYTYIFGAKKNRNLGIRNDVKGILELVIGGSIVFQEIGYLPLTIQTEIANLIRSNVIKPYGSDKNKSIDVRILATTSQDIEKLVETHKFKEGLFYQINSVSITLSPLYARKEDILPIAEYFFEKCIFESKKIITDIEPKVFYILKNYSWPNNVSELYNVIQRAVLNCNDSILRTYNISLHNFSTEENLMNNEDLNIITLREGINEFKKKYIYKSLMYNDWNHTKTANVLDIQRSYLSKLVKMYDLKSGNIKSNKQ